ncbi:hypothetical protein GX50_07193 [[Emmonsia] crescens]|uniref:Uncharacterized protein n=1 Tax=[Emmonsia] crescens TaxID=73230 RepID=A0A2B7ZB26_9EURO|nr:hypothetical protein GX50_07193 [Emmonsia crescens]
MDVSIVTNVSNQRSNTIPRSSSSQSHPITYAHSAHMDNVLLPRIPRIPNISLQCGVINTTLVTPVHPLTKLGTIKSIAAAKVQRNSEARPVQYGRAIQGQYGANLATRIGNVLGQAPFSPVLARISADTGNNDIVPDLIHERKTDVTPRPAIYTTPHYTTLQPPPPPPPPPPTTGFTFLQWVSFLGEFIRFALILQCNPPRRYFRRPTFPPVACATEKP